MKQAMSSILYKDFDVKNHLLILILMNVYGNVESEYHMSVSISDFMVRRGNKVRVVYNTHKRKILWLIKRLQKAQCGLIFR